MRFQADGGAIAQRWGRVEGRWHISGRERSLCEDEEKDAWQEKVARDKVGTSSGIQEGP